MTIDLNTIIQGVYSLATLKCYFPPKNIASPWHVDGLREIPFLRDIFMVQIVLG